MADRAKAEWHAVPESVRGEIARMHSEFNGAYQQYRGDYETMNSIRPFHQMAQQHGTTLQHALSNYVSMEQKLRSDLIGGLDTIVNNLNIPRTDGQKATLVDVAAHILNQSPEQHRLTAQSNAQVAQNHQIGALHQEIAGLKGALNQMHNGQQFAYLRQGIDQYAATHPRIEEHGGAVPLRPRSRFRSRHRIQASRPASATPCGSDPRPVGSDPAHRQVDPRRTRRDCLRRSVEEAGQACRPPRSHSARNQPRERFALIHSRERQSCPMFKRLPPISRS
jgi:hypothetical protein